MVVVVVVVWWCWYTVCFYSHLIILHHVKMCWSGVFFLSIYLVYTKMYDGGHSSITAFILHICANHMQQQKKLDSNVEHMLTPIKHVKQWGLFIEMHFGLGWIEMNNGTTKMKRKCCWTLQKLLLQSFSFIYFVSFFFVT